MEAFHVSLTSVRVGKKCLKCASALGGKPQAAFQESRPRDYHCGSLGVTLSYALEDSKNISAGVSFGKSILRWHGGPLPGEPGSL